MNEHQNKSTERLYDAIGGIDDKLIYDAQTPARAREYVYTRQRHRITVIAVACLFCIVAVVTLRLPDVIRENSKSPSDTNADTHSNAIQDKLEGHITLEAMLDGITVSSKVEQVKIEDIDLLDSTAKLIWQHDGEDAYNVTFISEKSDLNVITTQLDHPASQLSEDDSESVGVKVWISYGDGRVVSPYLKNTRGNTGYGVLFDYSAEVEPSEKLTSTIYKLFN